jgi:hypothetical protein
VTVLTQIAHLVYTLAVENPAMERWEQDFIRRHGMILPPGGFGGDRTMNTLMTIGGAAIGMIYAVVLLIMMVTPTVTAAFSGGPPPSDYEAGTRADEDDDYDRRRRDGWND